MEGESQTGGTTLETGRTESSSETAKNEGDYGSMTVPVFGFELSTRTMSGVMTLFIVEPMMAGHSGC